MDLIKKALVSVLVYVYICYLCFKQCKGKSMLKIDFQTRHIWHISKIKLTFQAENKQYLHKYTYDARISACKVGIHLLFVCLFLVGEDPKEGWLVNFEKHHDGSMLTKTKNLDLYLGFLISFVTRYTFSELSLSHLSPICRVGLRRRTAFIETLSGLKTLSKSINTVSLYVMFMGTG